MSDESPSKITDISSVSRLSVSELRASCGVFERQLDPLHARARVAIDALNLDRWRLELSVSIFGWSSDEANGSLLGLVRKAWGNEMAFGAMDVGGFSQRPDAMVVALEVKAETP